jgi:hypothetical protein
MVTIWRGSEQRSTRRLLFHFVGTDRLGHRKRMVRAVEELQPASPPAPAQVEPVVRRAAGASLADMVGRAGAAKRRCAVAPDYYV